MPQSPITVARCKDVRKANIGYGQLLRRPAGPRRLLADYETFTASHKAVWQRCPLFLRVQAAAVS